VGLNELNVINPAVLPPGGSLEVGDDSSPVGVSGRHSAAYAWSVSFLWVSGVSMSS